MLASRVMEAGKPALFNGQEWGWERAVELTHPPDHPGWFEVVVAQPVPFELGRFMRVWLTNSDMRL
jgi:hypothetical protein